MNFLERILARLMVWRLRKDFGMYGCRDYNEDCVVCRAKEVAEWLEEHYEV